MSNQTFAEYVEERAGVPLASLTPEKRLPWSLAYDKIQQNAEPNTQVIRDNWTLGKLWQATLEEGAAKFNVLRASILFEGAELEFKNPNLVQIDANKNYTMVFEIRRSPAAPNLLRENLFLSCVDKDSLTVSKAKCETILNLPQCFGRLAKSVKQDKFPKIWFKSFDCLEQGNEFATFSATFECPVIPKSAVYARSTISIEIPCRTAEMPVTPSVEEKMPTVTATYSNVDFEVLKSKKDKVKLEAQGRLPDRATLLKLAAKLTFKLVLVPVLGPVALVVPVPI